MATRESIFITSSDIKIEPKKSSTRLSGHYSGTERTTIVTRQLPEFETFGDALAHILERDDVDVDTAILKTQQEFPELYIQYCQEVRRELTT